MIRGQGNRNLVCTWTCTLHCSNRHTKHSNRTCACTLLPPLDATWHTRAPVMCETWEVSYDHCYHPITSLVKAAPLRSRLALVVAMIMPDLHNWCIITRVRVCKVVPVHTLSIGTCAHNSVHENEHFHHQYMHNNSKPSHTALHV